MALVALDLERPCDIVFKAAQYALFLVVSVGGGFDSYTQPMFAWRQFQSIELFSPHVVENDQMVPHLSMKRVGIGGAIVNPNGYLALIERMLNFQLDA